MRIAIISLPLSYNYGGYLQCFALMETLRLMGHDAFYLQRENGSNPSMIKKIVDSTKNLLEHIGLGEIVYFIEKKTNTGIFYKTKNFRMFTQKYIKSISPVLRTTQQVKEYCLNQKIDAYITGSDQIWRGEYQRSVNDAFLGFAPVNALKIAYAPSLGTSVWEFSKNDTLLIERLLNTFHAISVREQEGADLLKEHLKLKLNPVCVLDPTFLLPKEKYIEIAGTASKRNGVLTYILNNNEEKNRLIDEFCKKKNLSSYSVINPKTNTSGIAGSQGYSVEQWLAGFRDADYVMTDSFHAVVFSIIFNKPFWAFENPKRGNSRLLNILNLFECKDRFISVGTNTDNFDWERPVDWSQINKKKELLIRDSLCFLKESLDVDV